MRPTLRLLQIAANGAQRNKSISFIGLGRMGSEMAYNLFSRKLVESHGAARFVVCDAREATSVAFAHNFSQQFPGVRVEIANTPAEYVHSGVDALLEGALLRIDALLTTLSQSIACF